MALGAPNQELQNRVNSELLKAGFTKNDMRRYSVKYLPSVINPDEHIEAAVSGRQKGHEGMFGLIEGMLVATNQRVIFIDHRPGYTTMDDITYDVVAGVNLSTTLFFASVTLYTRVMNYQLSYVSSKSAQKFANFIEKQHIRTTQKQLSTNNNSANQKKPSKQTKAQHLNQNILNFLNNHRVGVLSSLDRTGNINSSTIYYTLLNEQIYFATKSNTQKARNFLSHQQVAFTVFDEVNLQTTEIQGIVQTVSDKILKQQVINHVTKPHIYADGNSKTPLQRLNQNPLIVYNILPTSANYINYKKLG